MRVINECVIGMWTLFWQLTDHANVFIPTQKIQTFSWRSSSRAASGCTEDSIVVQILESRQCETEESPFEDEPQDEVVPFAEADGIVNFPSLSHEGICWWSVALCHGIVR